MPAANVTNVFECVPVTGRHRELFGRDIPALLGVQTIPEASAILRRLCNNNGEISSDLQDYFSILREGDYIDGLSLDGITLPENGIVTDPPAAWNNTYKNNRIRIVGFSTYKGVGASIAKKNYIKFDFANVVFKSKFHSSTPLDGGYPASELRAFLEGAGGDGTGPFAVKLKEQLGGEYLLKESVCRVNDGTVEIRTPLSVCLPYEFEVFGYSRNGESPSDYQTDLVHLPLYRDNINRARKWNGSYSDWRLASMNTASTKTTVCHVNNNTVPSGSSVATIIGVSPVFNFA
jgi:hypothetical protein